MIHFEDQGVAIAEKDASYIGHLPGRHGDVFERLVDRTNPERLVHVGAAEGAAVMGTTVGDLEQVAVGLAGRPDNGAMVSHGIIMPVRGEIDNLVDSAVPVLTFVTTRLPIGVNMHVSRFMIYPFCGAEVGAIVVAYSNRSDERTWQSHAMQLTDNRTVF